MEWLNIHSSTLDSEEFLSSNEVEQATWLKLLRYCAGQENGGTILRAKDWNDKNWQYLARVTLKEVNRKCKLWQWQSDDLLVKFYPLNKEVEVQAKRRAAEHTNNKRHAQRTDDDPDKRHAERHAERDAKGREGKGSTMEGKGRESVPQKLLRLDKRIQSLEVELVGYPVFSDEADEVNEELEILKKERAALT